MSMNKYTLILFLILAAYLNPPKENYINWAKGNMLGSNASTIGSMVASGLIDKTTTEKNIYFGTIYTTNYGGRKETTLGMFGNFIPLK